MDPRLEEAWQTGRMIRPNAKSPNFMDLVRAITLLAGCPDPICCDNVNRIGKLIGQADHLVFVLVDAMGVSMFPSLPADSFMRTHLVEELISTYPSTTACTMTSLATCMWTSEHGLPEWWAYLDEFDLSVTTLPFTERFTKTPLEEYGVHAEDLWPLPSVVPRMMHDVLTVKPDDLWDSTFSRYFRGGRTGAGYSSIPNAVDIVLDHVASEHPTYTFFYLPQLDRACHDYGVGSREADECLAYIDAEMAHLAEGLDGRARLVISADHGQVNVEHGDLLTITDGDPLLEFLYAPPTGSARLPICHVRDGCRDAFASMFQERFGEHVVLLPSEEVDSLRLFGPTPFSALAKRRYGDFIGFALGHMGLMYYPPDKPLEEADIGRHSGMTPDEMCIPLILA